MWRLVLLMMFTLKVSPNVSPSPAVITATVTTEPQEAARSLRVDLNGEDFYRSSTLPMNGDKAAKTNRVTWTRVPAGEYQIDAWLLGTSDVVLEHQTQQAVVQ